MNNNSVLSQIPPEHQDELYTGFDDIARAVSGYSKCFRNKVVLCNCDDPFESNFFRYFALNFRALRLKKLICISYENSPIANREIRLFPPNSSYSHVPYKIEISREEYAEIKGKADLEKIAVILKGNPFNMFAFGLSADFRSYNSLKILAQADIAAGYPPPSRFAEYLWFLQNYQKKFLLLGKHASINSSEMAQLFKDRPQPWSNTPKSLAMSLYSPYLPENANTIKVPGMAWFTNLTPNPTVPR